VKKCTGGNHRRKRGNKVDCCSSSKECRVEKKERKKKKKKATFPRKRGKLSGAVGLGGRGRRDPSVHGKNKSPA